MKRQQYDTIFLAPHLDDAVLSCGGTIHQRTSNGRSVLVVTVMAGDAPASASSYAQGLRDRWQLAQNPEAARRAEDKEACGILGAHSLHWPIPDCIYRGTEDGSMFYQSDEEIFGPVHPLDQPLVQTVEERLRTLPRAAQIVSPLTVGHHVDHALVRAAAERVFGPGLLYYEDFPYAQEEGAVPAALQPEDGSWQARVETLTPADLEAKVQAILAYRSQISTFWANREEVERDVIGFARSVGGERYWRLLR